MWIRVHASRTSFSAARKAIYLAGASSTDDEALFTVLNRRSGSDLGGHIDNLLTPRADENNVDH